MVRINNTQYFHFLQQADALRRSGALCDATISVKSHTFRAHRLVLACASRRLAQQLGQGDTESPAYCSLELFSPRTFQQVLDFTYTQALDVSVEDLYLLLRAAQLLEMLPLEDQCRRQLRSLNHRAGAEEEEEEGAGDPRGAIKGVKEENASSGEMGQTEEGSPAGEEIPRETKERRASRGIVVENLTSPDFEKHASSPPGRETPRLCPSSSAPYHRDNAVTWPAATAGSSSPVPSPRSFSANMWSPVSALRRIAENYSSFFGAHPLQSPDQSAVTYPFSLSTSRVLPLFGPHFQHRVHDSVVDYSAFYPRYTQSCYAGSTGVGGIMKRGLLKRKKNSQRAFGGVVENSQPAVHKANTESVKNCRRCNTSLLGDPVLRESASAPPGEVCAACQLCRRGGVPQSKQQKHDYRGEKPYQCQHCPKKFTLKHQLDTHHRVHTGEKPFECRRCGQRSRDYSAMIKHLRTHGGAAPYQCTVCLEYCNSLVAMQRHIKIHSVQDFPPDWSINSTYLYISHI